MKAPRVQADREGRANRPHHLDRGPFRCRRYRRDPGSGLSGTVPGLGQNHIWGIGGRDVQYHVDCTESDPSEGRGGSGRDGV